MELMKDLVTCVQYKFWFQGLDSITNLRSCVYVRVSKNFSSVCCHGCETDIFDVRVHCQNLHPLQSCILVCMGEQMISNHIVQMCS